MERKKLLIKRIGSLIGAILVACTCLVTTFVPAFAISAETGSDSADPEGGVAVHNYNIMHLDTFIDHTVTSNSWMDYPYAVTSSSVELNRPVDVDFWYYIANEPETFSWSVGPLQTYAGGWAMRQSVRFFPSQIRRFTFTNSQPFTFYLSMFNDLRTYSRLYLNGYTDVEYNMTGVFWVPVSNDSGTGYEWERRKVSYTSEGLSNTTPDEKELLMVPTAITFFGAYYYDFLNKFCICETFTINFTLESNNDSTFNYFDFKMPYMYGDNYMNVVDLFAKYPSTVVQTVGDVDLTTWLSTALRGFWNFQILSNATIGEVFSVVVGIMLLVAFLHIIRR